MSTLTTPRTSPPTRGNRVRWRIPARPRKSILVTHVVAAGAWIGFDVISAVLVAVGWVREGDDRTAVYRVLADYFVVPLLLSALVAGSICLGTGVLLGMATKWGLVRYRWVAVKLVLNVIACVMLLVFLGPITELATGEQPLQDIWSVAFLAATAMVSLSFPMVLSVFKRWGRVRKPA
ncbi:hypothetical protein [Streptomyces stelliscabiei]|uniref:hypothetical protein n=1 Tax=Streptomyces stelliscabiei TaxID=146820 RepID=UPI0029A1DDE9|nr:hypothetical protein [Streptomyces stelliscabiei]MDX2556525.1 hypothetical protein [Streptomyces stelliscabiei]MDX2615205.1 hypothetical protein [Streptomyces stelliscabiei]MDX2640190.1 hypothetical protein [Streptomyces stelliscabiei]MDX2666902.1 hypothetical protein [Streptomyces stelliscabiei]MDX2717674.1 hypothetical protein [Streptomyces stelliscabiei]